MFRKIQNKLNLASRFDILLVIDAILKKEKYGRLSPKTIKRLEIYYNYYKEKNPNFENKD